MGLKLSKRRFSIKLVYSYTSRTEIALGISILDSFLSRHGYHVEQYILDCNFNSFINRLMTKHSFTSKILNELHYRYANSNNSYYPFITALDNTIDSMSLNNFDLLGFSVHSKLQLFLYLVLAKRIKQRYDIPIVFGGAYIKLFHELIDLKKYRFIDFMVTSDGELALLELVRYLEGKQGDVHKIHSLKYISNNKILRNKESCIDINKVPVPIYDKQRLKQIVNSYLGVTWGLPYEITKGCPFNCSFCSHGNLNKPQRKSIDVVIKDLNLIKKAYNCNRFRFVDSTINIDLKFLEKFCDAIIRENLDIEWVCLASPILKLDLLKKMKKARCSAIMYGVETGSPRIIKVLRKPFTVVVAEKCIRETFQVGIKNVIFLIVGSPGETSTDIKATIEFIKRNREMIHEVFLSRFQLKYNSYMYKQPTKFNIRIIGKLSKLDPDTFKFDEINGLGWGQKIKQTRKHIKVIKKQLKKYKIPCIYLPRVT